MQFDFVTASRILFGPGRLNSIGNIAEEFGNSAFVIFNGQKETTERLISLLSAHDIRYFSAKIDHEPTIDSIRGLVDLVHRLSPDMIIGIGGGSAIDSAKATSVLSTNPGDITDYLEVIGQNQPLLIPSIPVIAIPTTSGTGSEVTRNAVLGSPAEMVKVSLRSPYLLPRIALVDPELALSVSPKVTAYTGLDALTQLIEPYTCNVPNPVTDVICLEGIQRIAHSIFQVYDDGNNLLPREDMALASLFGGLALANAKLGAVHGLAGPLGGEIPAPHGAICARLLPYVIDANLAALNERSPRNPVLERYTKIGEILCDDPLANIDEGLQWIRDFCTHANILPLSAYGLSEDKFDKVLEKAIISSSMKGNPITLSKEELRIILQNAL